MHYIEKSIKDWIVKSLQESILLCDFSDFIDSEAFDFTDSFTIQSQSDYNNDFGPNFFEEKFVSVL